MVCQPGMHTHSKASTSLKAVQRHSATFVTGDYLTTSSVSDMMSNLILGWETLYHTCDKFKKGIREVFFSFQGGFSTSSPKGNDRSPENKQVFLIVL